MVGVRKIQAEAHVGELRLDFNVSGQQLNRSKQSTVGVASLVEFDGGESQAVISLAEARILLDGLAVVQGCLLILACREEFVALRHIALLRRTASGQSRERENENAEASCFDQARSPLAFDRSRARPACRSLRSQSPFFSIQRAKP